MSKCYHSRVEMPISQQINDVIQMLQDAEHPSIAPKTMRERIIAAGQAKFLSELQQITRDAPDAGEQVKQLLAAHWEFSKDTPLMYTALPQSALTRACSALAIAVSHDVNHTKTPALEILMPGLVTESMVDGYPDLTEPASNQEAWLKEVLSTHITRKGGGCLIPIALLTTEAEEDKLRNPYTDVDSENYDDYYVSDEEKIRLKEHSTFTEAIRDIEDSLQAIQSGDTSLLGRLNRFLNLLHLYSAQGLGEEENAAGGAYPAIIDFMEYYQALPEATKVEIPQAVKQQIDLIFNLSSDVTKNTNATENIETCTATRRSQLHAAVAANEEALASIGTSEAAKGEDITRARASLTEARAALKSAIDSHRYEGHDGAPINPGILSRLDLKFSIENESDFEEIFRLSVDEIQAICADERVKLDIMRYLNQEGTGVEKLVIAAISAAAEKFAAFLGQLKAELTQGENALLGEAQNLSTLLVSLDAERIQHICQTIGSDVVKRFSDFNNVLENLDPEQRTIVFNMMRDKLPVLIKSTSQLQTLRAFRDVLEYLNPEQRTSIFDTMKGDLPNLIKSPSAFRMVLEYLSPEQCTRLCDAMKEAGSDVIHSADQFTFVLGNLSSEQRTSVLDAIKHKLPDLIKSADDFNGVMEYFNPEQRTIVFKAMKGKLPAIIQDADAFNALMANINSEQRTIVLEAMKDKLSAMIQDAYAFDDVMRALNSEQRTIVFDAMKGKLPEFIQDADAFDYVMNSLDSGQPTIVFNEMGGAPKLSTLVNNIHDFKVAMLYLNEDSQVEVTKILIQKATLPIDAMLSVAYEKGNVALFEVLARHISLAEDILSNACKDDKINIARFLVKEGLKPTDELLQDMISAKKITAIHALIDGNAVSPNDIYTSAYRQGNIDVMKALSPDRVQPTEAMFSQACRDGKLEIAQFLAEQLIPDIIKSKYGENLSDHVIPQLVQAMNKDNLSSLAKTGLHHFVSNQLNQPESEQNLTSMFKTRINEVTERQPGTEQELKENPRSPK